MICLSRPKPSPHVVKPPSKLLWKVHFDANSGLLSRSRIPTRRNLMSTLLVFSSSSLGREMNFRFPQALHRLSQFFEAIRVSGEDMPAAIFVDDGKKSYLLTIHRAESPCPESFDSTRRRSSTDYWSRALLFFVNTLVTTFQHGEPGFFCVAH